MKNKKLLIVAILIAGIPSFLLSILATSYIRDFLEDNIASGMASQHSAMIEKIAERKVFAENYVDEVAANEEILDSLEAQNVDELNNLIEPSIEIESLVFVNTDGTFIYPPDTMVSSEQRTALDLGEAKKDDDPALRYVAILERNGNKIGALEVCTKLDRAELDTLDQPGSELLFVDSGELIAGTIEGGFRKKNSVGKSVKVVNDRAISVGGKTYYASGLDLSSIGLNKNMVAYLAVEQNIILKLLNSFMVILLAFGIMIPVIFLTWGMLIEIIEVETSAALRNLRHSEGDDQQKKTDK